ncbi:unnamed protein product [Adineta ricciae]|uniref:Uncharacterized protein n=1 Tax=Adineta ricciae TaxID=249248 RepID=A0A815MYR6_ADIRI|nr:unnamed protein product [Adineta ricciae]
MHSCLILLTLWSYFGDCTQPYFPRQVVFSSDGGLIVAIDEINQRAYQTLNYTSTEQHTSFVMQHFPYAVPDSPQSKYYVQLLLRTPPSLGCQYGTYWKYGEQNFNDFPVHWWVTESSFEIKNYINFHFGMIHSKNTSSIDEDYWYSNETCMLEDKEILPCEEIYFKKNTEIPLRSTVVVRYGMQVIQEITNYKIISIGKPDEKYFDLIPKNWSVVCQDANLGIIYNPEAVTIDSNRSSDIHISLTAPPHRINGNDTVRIRWKVTQCKTCFKWIPEQLYFNSKNFQTTQILTIIRIKNGPLAKMFPIFKGGGFDSISTDDYSIIIT